MNVRTIRPGNEYRATIETLSLRFLADPAKRMVWVYAQQRLIGGFDVDRFGGKLDPDGIRRFTSAGSASAVTPRV
ncbi:hypothetical protein [Mycolicibacterium sp.]|uniref:hypothetical protein n=1 Tax=Mycolicibacterium sp. TaxID=2320850 RepID=UPI00355FEE1A